MLSEVWNVSTLTILLENWKKKCVSRSRCSVGSQRRISNKGWHQKGPNREMNVSYVVRGLWNYLNVRLHLSSRYFAKLLDFKLQKDFLCHCPHRSVWPVLVLKRQESLLLYLGGCLSGRWWNKFPPKQKEKKSHFLSFDLNTTVSLYICVEPKKKKNK